MRAGTAVLLPFVLLSVTALWKLCGVVVAVTSIIPPVLSATVVMDTAVLPSAVSPSLYGVFLEEISHAGQGGLYAQLINNSNLESSSQDFFPWIPLPTPHHSYLLSLSTDRPLTWQSPHSLRVRTTPTASLSGADVTVGVTNPGYWGIPVVDQTTFIVSLWAYSDTITSLTVALTSNDSQVVHGSLALDGVTGEWKELKGRISVPPSTFDPHAMFAITWGSPSTGGPVSVNVDVVTLFPDVGWKGLPFIRPDLADRIEAMKPSFIRMPGGGSAQHISAFQPTRTHQPNPRASRSYEAVTLCCVSR